MKAFIGAIVVVCILTVLYFVYDSQQTVHVPPPSSTATSTTADLYQIIPGVPSIMYTDPRFGFSLYYPATAALKATGFDGYLPLTHTPLIAFTLNPDMFVGTNLNEAGLYVGATTSPSIVAHCVEPIINDLETIASSSVMIQGTVFDEFDSTGAAAGNIYQERVFRTVRDGTCMEFVELLHSGNIDNYPKGKVVAFDSAAFTGTLDSMLQTLTFTRTATPK
ncbi:MAG TPA: hypothetical protein VMU13_00155 [Candidatus Paceibacterota bacterium]|nr:hypothetical protein [Candidatus Paceibacterota bacterium]